MRCHVTSHANQANHLEKFSLFAPHSSNLPPAMTPPIYLSCTNTNKITIFHFNNILPPSTLPKNNDSSTIPPGTDATTNTRPRSLSSPRMMDPYSSKHRHSPSCWKIQDDAPPPPSPCWP